MKKSPKNLVAYFLFIVIFILGVTIGAAGEKAHSHVSFTVSPGFPCHGECPETYNYEVNADSAIKILGQVIKHQGGIFKIN